MNPKALYRLGYGLYVIGSKNGDRLNAQIANSVFQVTSDPPTIAVSINMKNLTRDLIAESKVFTASVLHRDTPLSFIGALGFKSGRDADKLAGLGYQLGVTAAPIVTDNAVSYLEARVVNQIDVGTHTIFVGEVIGGELINDLPSMTYEYYQQVKRGATSPAAPSYQPAKKEAPLASTSYTCTVCGYIYDPEKGDPDAGIKPGTPFEKLPDDWVCPTCGANKSEFKQV